MVINRYFSLGGRFGFRLLRQPFLLIFGFKSSKRYQIAVSDLGSELRSQKRHALAFEPKKSHPEVLRFPLRVGNRFFAAATVSLITEQPQKGSPPAENKASMRHSSRKQR
jgi:hypothetical protein